MRSGIRRERGRSERLLRVGWRAEFDDDVSTFDFMLGSLQASTAPATRAYALPNATFAARRNSYDLPRLPAGHVIHSVDAGGRKHGRLESALKLKQAGHNQTARGQHLLRKPANLQPLHHPNTSSLLSARTLSATLPLTNPSPKFSNPQSV